MRDDLIYRVIVNSKTAQKKHGRYVTYELLGMKVTVHKFVSKKINTFLASGKKKVLYNYLNNYSPNITTNFL